MGNDVRVVIVSDGNALPPNYIERGADGDVLVLHAYEREAVSSGFACRPGDDVETFVPGATGTIKPHLIA